MDNDKWIFLTFWSKPMGERFELNLYIAALSLEFAHRSGYKVRMHTDSKAYPILVRFGYDDIKKTLDTIPQDIPTIFFAYPKFHAGLTEDLETIHTDFDVFLQKPCLDHFFNNKNFDIILQNRELWSDNGHHTMLKMKFCQLGYPEYIPIGYVGSSNVGAIGFRNKELKDKYFETYFKCIDYYKLYADEFKGQVPDIMFELVIIDKMILDKNVYYLMPPFKDGDYLHSLGGKIGYMHLLGTTKYTCMKEIIRLNLKIFNPILYNIIKTYKL